MDLKAWPLCPKCGSKRVSVATIDSETKCEHCGAKRYVPTTHECFKWTVWCYSCNFWAKECTTLDEAMDAFLAEEEQC